MICYNGVISKMVYIHYYRGDYFITHNNEGTKNCEILSKS